MRKQREDRWIINLIKRIIISLGSATGGALINIVVAPLSSPVENLEKQIWSWLIHDGQKHLSWASIKLDISLLLACIIALLVFVLAYLKGTFSSRKQPHFPKEWKREPNPYAWHQQWGQKKPPLPHSSGTP